MSPVQKDICRSPSLFETAIHQSSAWRNAMLAGASAVGMTVFWHNRAGLAAVGDARPAHMANTLTPLLDLV